MTKHIHGTILTQYGVAANNRGENEGNLTTLQKILWKGQTHSTVSAEAIRFAMRLYWQRVYEESENPLLRVNRIWDESLQDSHFEDQAFSSETYIDDDVMGFMDAKAAKAEKEDNETDEGRKSSKRAKGTTTARRGPLEVTRAVSLTPFVGETTFNARSGQKGKTSLYATEIHATSYQYSFSLTPTFLTKQERAAAVIEALISLGTVGGNHGRFLYDFSPSSVIFRVTDDPAPRILYVAEQEIGEPIRITELVKRVQAGDIQGSELIVGGEISNLEDTQILREHGAKVIPGVKEAAALVIREL